MFDGVKWYEHSKVVPPVGYDETPHITTMWGSEPNETYAVGGVYRSSDNTYKGIIMKFNGSSWNYVNIPDIRVNFGIIRKQFTTNLYFLEGIQFESTGYIYKLYIYDGQNNLEEIYSSKDYYMSMFSMAGEVYFCKYLTSKIYKYTNGALVLWKDFSATEYSSGLVGRNEKDFFGIGKENDILHYYRDHFTVVFKNKVRVTNWFLVDDTVFFVCQDYDNMITKVIKGTIKK